MDEQKSVNMPNYKSMLEYYQEHQFNPVFIPLQTQDQWQTHVAKRTNLYQRHLSIPISLLSDRAIIEFGCNSGENALVLAAAGAKLTLVEPNTQVIPRLVALFSQFKLEKQIVDLATQTIAEFQSSERYDLVIAEGFLYTLPDRDSLFLKLTELMAPGGLTVISFNDRYGCLLEITKQVLLWRACQLAHIENMQSAESLELAKRLYAEDFAKLNASRTFDAWWKDTLVNPFITSRYLWSYPELFELIEKANCEFYSSSPQWTTSKHFQWYKAVETETQRNINLLNSWKSSFSYFLSGIPCIAEKSTENDSDIDLVISEVATWIERLSGFTSSQNPQNTIQLLETIKYPQLLDRYLSKLPDPKFQQFNNELKRLYDTISADSLENMIHTYLNSSIRNLWGTAYHYICLIKGSGETAPFTKEA
jgi:SAM-dependent methyltransferase